MGWFDDFTLILHSLYVFRSIDLAGMLIHEGVEAMVVEIYHIVVARETIINNIAIKPLIDALAVSAIADTGIIDLSLTFGPFLNVLFSAEPTTHATCCTVLC